NEHFGDFQSLVAKRRFKSSNHSGIEIRPRTFHDGIASFERRKSFAIRPVTDQRIVNVGDADDARLDRNLVSLGWVVARTVKLVMMSQYDAKDAGERAVKGHQHIYAFFDVGFDLGH